MLSYDELLKPRYEVIADYPGSPYSFGDILVQLRPHGYWSLPSDQCRIADDLLKYPHLFKPLQWWEHRKPEEMPEYVKYWDISSFFPVDRVCKTTEAPFNSINFTADNFQPATEAEYFEYINCKK